MTEATFLILYDVARTVIRTVTLGLLVVMSEISAFAHMKAWLFGSVIPSDIRASSLQKLGHVVHVLTMYQRSSRWKAVVPYETRDS